MFLHGKLILRSINWLKLGYKSIKILHADKSNNVFKESFIYLHVHVFGSLDKYQVTAREARIQAFIRKPRHQNCTVA